MGLTFISSQTASSDSSLDFTSGIDSTYNEYLFTIVNYKPVTDESKLGFQVDTGTNTSYGQTITSTSWKAGHAEDDGWSVLSYNGDEDQAQGVALQRISYSGESGSNEMTSSGTLTLYAPSDGTYVKHFTARVNTQYQSGSNKYAIDNFVAGYVNTATALTRVRFATTSGNILTGTIALYGVS